MTFSRIPPHFTLSEATSAEPTRPPNSACDDEDGRPKYQVSRFQAMAPTTPANTTPSPDTPCGGAIRPLPTVCATRSPKCVPMKLPIAAISNATRGVRARVLMLVAIALAASWKPLV